MKNLITAALMTKWKFLKAIEPLLISYLRIKHDLSVLLNLEYSKSYFFNSFITKLNCKVDSYLTTPTKKSGDTTK